MVSAIPTAARHDHAGQGPKAKPMRIMLVDDEESILRSLKRVLRNEPYDLTTTTDAQQALALMDADPVDLVVSDQRMPAMSGTELLKQVRERWPDTVRIILSGFSEVSSILDAVNGGAIYKYLTKPWNDEELKLSIRRAAEQARLIQENRQLTATIEEQNSRLRSLSLRLLQRAEDAILGMNMSQDMMDVVSAGVINVGVDGMVVGANERASELMGVRPGELHGLQAKDVLPAEVLEMIQSHATIDADEYCTEIDIRDKRFQICSRRFCVGQEHRGQVFTIWEML